MQVKKKCLQKDGETKKLFVAGTAFKKMFAFKNVPIPSAPCQKIMVRPHLLSGAYMYACKNLQQSGLVWRGR